MKITKSQLKEIIKEEVSRLQKKTILENRKKAIIKELRMLNEGVSIDEAGIVERLKDGLEELEETLEDYGMSYHIVEKIESIIEEIGKEQGLSEADAEKLAEKANIKDDYNTSYNEYDESTIEGNVSFNGKEIVSFSSHGDGYGFSYESDINVDALKLIAQGLLKELNGNNLNETENVEEIVGALQKGMQKVAGKVGLGKSKWEGKIKKAEALKRPIFYTFYGNGPKKSSTWKGQNDSKTFLKKVEEVGWTGFAVVYYNFMDKNSNVYFYWVPESSDMKDAAPSKPANEKSLDGASDYKFSA